MTDIHLDRDDQVDELVETARTDRTAFGQLFEHFYPPIFAYTTRRLIVRAVAEDVTSEVFVKVANSIRTFSGTSAEDFRRWLFRIATNEINAYLRQSIRRRELLEAAVHMGRINAAVSTPLTGRDDAVEWSELYEALNELSDREQSIISLRFFGDLKHDQIADVLKIKTGTVRVALSRALEKLREGLREEPPERDATVASPFGPTGGGNQS